ncbi:lipopolysaccharide biosynthesis protein [Colwellia sp. D2M02]|uniref:lipopolysaccharide biosynthesis protein n=1 Tax=Colwellia sp. D2M02 TaxID=2841562 RepID=UPI001C087A1E|nr:lipopolysaccharide biosynthesis protein [Colwellia sp. D2M02]MBU2891923.1 lipopolysaccharide biosynthesis protein [Colwellia sp. D2M02]
MFFTMKVQGLVRGIAHALSGNLIAAILAFASTALYSRYLGAAEFGTLVLLQSYVFVFCALANPQSWQALIKFGAEHKNSNNLLYQAVVFVCAIQDIIYACLGAIIAYFLSPYFISYFNLSATLAEPLQLFCLVIFFSQIGLGIGVLRLAGKFSTVALQVVFAAMINFAVALATIYYKLAISDILFLLTLSMSLGAILLIFLGLYSLKNQVGTFTLKGITSKNFNWKDVVRFNIYTHFTNVADIPVKFLDTIFVGALLTVEAAGVYKIIRQLGTIIDKFTGPVAQVLFPEFSKLLADKQYAQASRLIFKVTSVVMAVAVPFAIVLSLSAVYWLPLIFGQYMSDYVIQLGVFFIIQALTVSFMGIHPLFVALGFVREQLWLTVFLNIAFILCTYVFSAYIALFGVIIALAIQYAGTIGIKLFLIKRTLKTS